MADELGGIYYKNDESFDFDAACAFFKEKNIFLLNQPDNGKIIALDYYGDDYEISYERAKQKALNGSMFNLKFWLNYKWRVILTFRRENKCLILEFDLFGMYSNKKEIVSKVLFSFFIHELVDKYNSLLGMFIDQSGATYEYDFTPVFTTNSEEVDYVTDLICLPKEKLGLIVMEPGFSMKELNNGFICASRYPDFLDYLMSNFPANESSQ